MFLKYEQLIMQLSINYRSVRFLLSAHIQFVGSI